MTADPITCEWCRAKFTQPHVKGPVPRFCSKAHRQYSFQKVKMDRLTERIKELEAEVERLTAGVSR